MAPTADKQDILAQGILYLRKPEFLALGEMMHNLVSHEWHPIRPELATIANFVALGLIRINKPVLILDSVSSGDF